MLLELLGPLDAHQGHQEQGQHRGAQTVEGRGQAAVDLACYAEDAAVLERRQRQQHARADDLRPRAEQRGRVVQQPQGGQDAVRVASRGVAVERPGGGLRGVGLWTGQFWVRRRRGRLRRGESKMSCEG